MGIMFWFDIRDIMWYVKWYLLIVWFLFVSLFICILLFVIFVKVIWEIIEFYRSGFCKVLLLFFYVWYVM